jgi:hypothetical protein
VADLPPVRAEVTEYHGHGRRCPGCGEVTWQSIPAEYCRQSIGPGLAAAMGYLAGCHQVSKRGVEEIVETLFEAPLAPGSVANVEKELTAALTTPHIEAVLPGQEAPVTHVDETGWKWRGQKGWLWVAATAQVAGFVLRAGRGLAGLALLLGRAIGGIAVSDRWWANRLLPVFRVERVPRKAVLWRKPSFGCASAEDCKFVARVLTVVQTLRLHQRQVWRFYQQSIGAHRAHQPAPSLLAR